MKKTTLAAGLMALAGVSSVGCKTTPKLAWWKPTRRPRARRSPTRRRRCPRTSPSKRRTAADGSAQVATGRPVRARQSRRRGRARRPGRLPEHRRAGVHARRCQPHRQVADAAVAREPTIPTIPATSTAATSSAANLGTIAATPYNPARRRARRPRRRARRRRPCLDRYGRSDAPTYGSRLRLARYEPGRRRRRRWRDTPSAGAGSSYVDATSTAPRYSPLARRQRCRREPGSGIGATTAGATTAGARRPAAPAVTPGFANTTGNTAGASTGQYDVTGGATAAGAAVGGATTGVVNRPLPSRRPRSLSPRRHGHVSDTVAGARSRPRPQAANIDPGADGGLCAECRPAWWAGSTASSRRRRRPRRRGIGSRGVARYPCGRRLRRRLRATSQTVA